jgi:hypothetical protein
MIEKLQDRVNSDELLVHRGRFVNTTILLEIGAQTWLVRIQDGRIAEIAKGPFVMPSWTFALRAPEDAWKTYAQTVPPPGFNDLFALIKRRALRVEGDMHPFMANLFYFKGMLAKLREEQ